MEKKHLFIIFIIALLCTLCVVITSCSKNAQGQKGDDLQQTNTDLNTQNQVSESIIEATPDEYFRFSLLNDDTYEISARYQDMPPRTVIPATHEGKPVTAIAKDAFKDRTSIDEIKIPSSVTSIGESAFRGCSFLETVNASDNITTIGSSAFYGCTLLDHFTIPKGLTRIESSLFYLCKNLSDIPIPDGVTHIGNYAFFGCERLRFITIPNKVTTLGQGTFYGCTGLISITLSESITSIESNAFDGCYKLIEIYNKSALNIPKGRVSQYGEQPLGGIGNYAKNIYSEEGGSKLSTDENGFVIFEEDGCRAVVEYVGSKPDAVFPNEITEIYYYTFLNSDAVKSIIYQGTMEEWNNLVGDKSYYTCLIYCSDGVIKKENY